MSKLIDLKTSIFKRGNMDLKEKRILVSLISSVLIMAFYWLYVYYNFIEGNPALLNDMRFLGKAFLIMIPVAIGAQIVIQIVLAIAFKMAGHDDIDPIDDERDKLIELKSIKISHYIFILGFMLAMGCLAMGMHTRIMIFVLIASGFVASVVNELLRLWYYRKGV
ncbi:MAG: hypothetical protein FD166_265 [Bacteroidetes bacterium]|nr:MAG: hypothetical protein FD166_265 [Bacteroidota bacterium]